MNTFTCAIFGETTLPLQCAEILLAQGHTISAFVSPNPQAARQAKERNIPFFSPDEDVLTVLQRQPPDYLFSIVNHRILPPAILNAPRRFAINYHDGPLPRYAGLNATSWAILNGESRHGVTWHCMTEKVDAGDILKQGFFDIDPADTALTLNAKSYETALRLFRELIADLSRGQVKRITQNLGGRSYFPRHKRPPAAAAIDWRSNAAEIDALTRALTFGAYPNPLGLPKFLSGSGALAFGSLELTGVPAAAPPGEIIALERDSLTLAAADQNVILRRITALNGLPLSPAALSRSLRPGNRLPLLSLALARQLDRINAQLAPHETFWRKRLASLRPLALPRPVFNEQPAAAEDKKSPLLRLPQALLPPDDGQTAFLILLAVFLARLSNQYAFDLAFTHPQLRRSLKGAEAFFALYPPLRMSSIEELAARPLHSAESRQLIQRELEINRRRQTWPRDLIARYPELRNNPARFTLPIALEILENPATLRPASGALLTVGLSPDGSAYTFLANPKSSAPYPAAQLARRFEIFARAVAQQPDAPLSQISLLLPAEERRLLPEWNNTARRYPADPVHRLFEAQAARAPAAPAVTFAGQSLTYAELNERAAQVARQLQQQGASAGTPVGVYLERSLEMAIAVLAILKAGGVCVPLDPAYPAERRNFMMTDAGIELLFTRAEADGNLAVTAPPQRGNPRTLPNNSPCLSPDNLVYILYTSGSTGVPKGVAMPHRSLSNLIQWHIKDSPLSAPARTLQFASLSFDVAFQEMFSTWAAGGTLILIREETQRDAAALLRFIDRNNVERLFLPVVALTQLAEAARRVAALPLSLRDIVVAGEQLQITPAIVELFNRLPGCALHNHYGPTESHVVTTCTLAGAPDDWPLLPPVGRPIANTQIHLLDRFLQPLPVGFSGELHIAGPSLACGYLNRPKLTAERFVRAKAGQSEGERLYKTGDIARYRPDGSLEFLGRADNQVKIRGFRVELGEIEAVLMRHPAVQKAVVTLREDRPGDKRLAAYIAPAQGAPKASALRKFLAARLPDYMLPAAFVFLDAFPLTPSNKIDRRALPAPAASRLELSQEFVAPRTSLQARLAALWADVLGVEQVGIHDDFFELGGHSLLAAQLVARLQAEFQTAYSLRQLFGAPTVAGTAAQLEKITRAPAAPIPRLPEDRNPPLSFAQQRLWFLDRLETNSALYNVPAVFELEGSLNLSVLQRALNEIIRRHNALRAVFPAQNGEATQQITPELALTLSPADLRSLPKAERQAEAARLLRAEIRRPFDLAAGPLLRVSLWRLSDARYLLALVMHHIICDGRSIEIFIRELAALYRAFWAGKPAPLEALPIQYGDFARWQKNRLRGERLELLLRYWRAQIGNAPPPLSLPADRPRPAVQRFRGAQYPLRLSQSLTQALKTLSRRKEVTLFMTLLAAFHALLYRYTGQQDIIIASPLANRSRAEIEGLIGLFVNTLLFRASLSGSLSFAELLAQLWQTALDAYAHQELPFEKLVESLHPERSLSYQPLFQVMFTLHNSPLPALKLPELRLSPVDPPDSGTAKFDLTLTLTDTPEGLTGALTYNTDLFNAERIARMAGHFQTLLKGVVANPGQPVARLPLLTAAEHRFLQNLNNTARAYPKNQLVHQLFEAWAIKTPHAPALIFEDTQLSYAELNRLAEQLARQLQLPGVAPETPVGLVLPRSADFIIALLGVLKAGGAYLPLDPDWPEERQQLVLQSAGVRVVVASGEWRMANGEWRMANGELRVTNDELRMANGEWRMAIYDLRTATRQLFPLRAKQQSQPPTPNPQPPKPETSTPTPETLAYILFTSGSTGEPKGVMVEHRQLTNYLYGITERLELDEGLSYALLSSVAADLGNTAIFGALCTGGALHVISAERARDPESLSAYFRRHPVDALKIVPSHLSALLSAARPADILPRRRLILGGEALSWELVERVQLLAPKCVIFNHYGPAEATIGATTYRVGADKPRPAAATVPIGRSLPNVQIHLLDANRQPLPVGVPGEVYIAGAGVSRGYLNRPQTDPKGFQNRFQEKESLQNTAASGQNSPVKPFGSLKRVGPVYKTGDIARYLPDGNLEFLGRADEQVKIRGFRVELGEIEAALKRHSAVSEAVVILREDVPKQKQAAAYVVSAEQPAADDLPEKLLAHLKKRLPNYMIPATVTLLDALPLTANGKIDRKRLPLPRRRRSREESAFAPPQNRLEKTLAEIWEKVLGVKRVGRNDNFFELGGDSILSIQVIAAANQAGLKLTPKQFFQHQRIAELARVAGETQAPPAAQGAVTGSLPLTPIQRWFFEQNLPRPEHWNMPLLLEAQQPLDAGLLQKSLRQLALHHDALRLRFTRAPAGWRQHHAGTKSPFLLEQVDLSGVEAALREKAALEKMTALQASLNLSEGPLARAALFDFGAGRPARLLIAVHHLLVDGVSWRILLEDLQTLYRQLEKGEPAQLPPKTTSFKRWAEALTDFAQSSDLQAEAAYWLPEAPPEIASLPLDFSAAPQANTEASTQILRSRFSAEETRVLLEDLPTTTGASINRALLAALAITLARWTGGNNLLIELEGHGREEIAADVDLSRTVGWFTTHFPLYLLLPEQAAQAAPSGAVMRETLQGVNAQLERLPRRGIGYGLLRYLRQDWETAEKLRRMPQPEIIFNYLGQFRQASSPDALFRRTDEPSGDSRYPAAARSHLLYLGGRVVDDRLEVEWRYSRNLHRRETIESLAADFSRNLRLLVQDAAARGLTADRRPLTADKGQMTNDEGQMTNDEGQMTNDEGQMTNDKGQMTNDKGQMTNDKGQMTNDEGQMTNDEGQMTNDEGQMTAGKEQTRPQTPNPQPETLNPLSPFQQEMLRYARSPAAQAEVYCVQLNFTLRGGLNVSAFKRAWQTAMARHSILRTAFVWQNAPEPQQIVFEAVEPTWTEANWQNLPPAEQKECLTTFLRADRQRGFALTRPPLMRLALFKLAEARHQFVWSSHHLLKDGWSTEIILRDVFALYSAYAGGKSPELAEAPPYADYIAWLRAQDLTPAKNFWQQNRLSAALPKGVKSPEYAAAIIPAQRRIDAPEMNYCHLRQWAREHRLTVNTLIQGAWAMALGSVTGSAEVVFGVVISGRPPQLAGATKMAGPFINLLPLFVRLPGETMTSAWLRQLQTRQLELQQYPYVSLTRIKNWLTIPKEQALFNSVLRFQNYPFNPAAWSGKTGLRFEKPDFFDRWPYPLNVIVTPEPDFSVLLTWNRRHFDDQTVERLLARFLRHLQK